VLAAIKLPDQTTESARESLEELAILCSSAGGEVVADILQARDRYHTGYLFGAGKLQEIKELCEETNAQLVIYDGELTASQQEKIESILDVAVIDRPALILDIFARHAKSREAKTQVELAQLEYLLPRLAGHWTHLERQEAAIGTRGPGETQLETDRRMIRRKIADLKKDLQKIDNDRTTRRKRRSDKINFCFVGYTNAGKSSLFNKLTGDSTLVADRLFATLDSTTRRVPLKGIGEFMLTDTVGFIKKLPVDLVASFRSTLREANSADMLLHVVDFSASDFDEKIRVVNEVLAEIGAADIERLLIFNKTDRVGNPELRRNVMLRYPSCRFVSAKTSEGIEPLHQYLIEACSMMYVEIKARISQQDSAGMALISKCMQVYNTECQDGYLIFKGKLLKFDRARLEKQGVIVEPIDSKP
jgi:GTP-binding protein HflX